MRAEAASAGFYQSPWGNHARLQLLTVPELLEGKRIDAPPMGQVGATFKKAPRKAEQHEHLTLSLRRRALEPECRGRVAPEETKDRWRVF